MSIKVIKVKMVDVYLGEIPSMSECTSLVDTFDEQIEIQIKPLKDACQ